MEKKKITKIKKNKWEITDKSLYEKELKPVFKNKCAIAFVLSDQYIPYFTVTLLSILDYISDEYEYDIVLLTSEIDLYDCQILLNLVKDYPNVSLRFFDPKPLVKEYMERSRYKYLYLNYFKLAIPWIFKEYKIVLNLGADVLARKDVYELLNVDFLEKEYIAGVVDLGYLGRLKMDIPLGELNLINPMGYVNADVLVFDLSNIRRDFSIDYVMNLWQKYKFRCAEQDAFNVLFDTKIKYLDSRWNVYPIRMASVEHIMQNEEKKIKEWEQNLKNPFIVHYAAFPKPWDYPLVGEGNHWWEYARQSPYYEEIIRKMCLLSIRGEINTRKNFNLRIIAEKIFPENSERREVLRSWFPKYSKQREFLKKIYYCFFTNPNPEWNKKFGKSVNNK
ncbi:glycosyltransferase [Veillonella sp. R32]|uniref:glycosyltransferase family 8 protein n=1 Tax=Veillonella sp. R32 TaxID=2021312 RepID=UPI00138A48AF|nr:glycosyltransferase [Veillonella sp. R32]KAF1680107.1 hypothetical protein VER_08710 [Veillonella sp. R32]